MEPELKQALAHKLLGLADDELILGHRDSEWTGHAPILEEDIALANIAQDEIGHAMIWYALLADLQGEDPEAYPDRLVFFREASAYRNVQLVELPGGDWAFTMVRQYLFDALETVHLEALTWSGYQPLAAAAAKIRTEEIYHFRHSRAWVQRLGLGTDESQQRLQRGLAQLWPYAQQLFEPGPEETLLVEASLIPDLTELRQTWDRLVRPQLEAAGLVIPGEVTPVAGPRSRHTEHLVALLEEMQEVARLDPQARW